MTSRTGSRNTLERAIEITDRHDDRRTLVFASPAPGLRRHLKGYCGYEERTDGAIRRLEVASSGATLIISFGPPVELLGPGDGSGASLQVTSFVAGPHTGYTIAVSPGWQHGVQVDLTPIGARRLFGVPMYELANHAVDLDAILGAAAGRVAERLAELRTWHDRFSLVEALIARRFALARDDSPGISKAWQRLTETAGQLRVGALASELGCSRQHLVRMFREGIGLSPKAAARVLRFEHAVVTLDAGAWRTMSDLAQECGYYDQAHLNRDFHEFAGTTPTAYLKGRLTGSAGVLWSGGHAQQSAQVG